MGDVVKLAARTFVERFDGVLSRQAAVTLLDVAEAIPEWLGEPGPTFTLTHGDYRLDNLMFTSSGEVIALDWQTVQIGPAGRDVAYFLETAFEPGDRRAVEDDAIDAFYEALVANGVTDYGRDVCY